MGQSLQRIAAILLGSALIVLGIGGALYFKNIADAKQVPVEQDRQRPLSLVDVYRLEAVAHAPRFQARGILEGLQETVVSAEVEGRVIERPVREGQTVQPGDLLCRIDDTFHQLTVRAVTAQLKEVEARYANAEAELGRVRDLEADHTTELEYNRYRTARDGALATRNRVQAELDKARELLARCTIVSPIRGQVARVYFEEGELLTPARPVAEIVNLELMKLRVDLPDFEASQLGEEPRAEIRSPSRPGKIFRGRVTAVYPKANPLTRRVPIEIEVDNPLGELRSGAFVSCVIERTGTVHRLLVPAQAVLHEFGAEFCYLAEPQDQGHAIQRRRVVSAPLAGSVRLREILEGLNPGELIVLNKHQELTAGELITTREVALRQDSPAGSSAQAGP